MRTLTPAEGIIAGSLAGVAEVTVNQPFIFFKNCIQVVSTIQVITISNAVISTLRPTPLVFLHQSRIFLKPYL